jgi:hypothetical protein
VLKRFILRSGPAEIHQFPNRVAIKPLNPGVPLKPFDRYLAREAVVGAVKSNQPGDDPLQERRAVGKNGLQDSSLALERHDVARTPFTVGVARQVGYRLAGLAVDCNPISFKGYFGVIVSDDLAVPGQHVDDLRLIAVCRRGGDVGSDDRIGTDGSARPVPVVHKRVHGDVFPIVIMISAAGGAVFLAADPAVNACQSIGHRRKPSEEPLLPLDAELEMA